MAFNLYPPSTLDFYHKLKLHFSPFIELNCEKINHACKGLGTDEKTLIKVLGDRSPNDRALISYRYKQRYHEELKNVLKSEADGDFGFLLQLITMPLPEAEAFILYTAMDRAGTAENLIYPIVMGRSCDEMTVLKKAYFDLHGKDLTVDLERELGGDFKRVILAAIESPVVPYNVAFHTTIKAEEDADKLYKAGEGKWGTDEQGFLKVLLASPPKYMEMINDAYVKKRKTTLIDAIKAEFTGDSEKALLFHVRAALEPKMLLAELFESTMKGPGTDETALCAAVVRYHPYLESISGAYEVLYRTTLKNRIMGEVSGDLKELLVKILDAPTTAPFVAEDA